MYRRLAIALSLVFLIAAGRALTGAATDAVFLDRYVWKEPGRWFGGFSGIELARNGRDFLTISDSGLLVRGTIERDAGRISAIRYDPPIVLRHRRPEDLTGHNRDAEGLSLRPGGGFCISFEGTARIGCFDRPGGDVVVIPREPEFDALHENRSLEALALDASGNIWTVPESSPRDRGGFPAYRWDGIRWSVPFVIPARGDFVPVGADFGPDGRFYLLERAASVFGFRSRVRSWRIGQDRLHDPRTHLQTASLVHDNLEGLSVWRDADGQLRLTMISDNNYLFIQRTEIVEYGLPTVRPATN